MTALDPLLAIAVAEPCVVGAPLLHRLVDGELSTTQTRHAAEHAQLCPTCREHLRWLELEQQTVREIAAPTPERFVALWSDRLRRRLVAAITDEAGAELVRVAGRSNGGSRRSAGRRVAAGNSSARGTSAGRDSEWSRALGYLRQLAGWLGRADLERRRGASSQAVLAGFAELLGEQWPPLQSARRALALAARRTPRPVSGRPPR